jgi:hypothetical protein
MSSGHAHNGGFGLDSGQLDRLLKNEAVQECLNRPFSVSYDFDLPYIAGYSQDGSKIYIDRHLPKQLKIELDGKRYDFDPTPFLLTHERTEKALIDAMHFGYTPAHRVATAAERRHLIQVLGPGLWPPYQAKMDQYAKHDEHEKLQKLPKDLDMTPYLAPPVNKSLLVHMEKLIGPAKHSKQDAEYSLERGKPNHHCGPDKGWPHGYCEYYEEENRCRRVYGYIAHRAGCKYWEKAEE